MKSSDNPMIKDKIDQNIDLYLNMLALSIDTVDKLAQNNLVYSQAMLDNSLKLIQPLSNKNGMQDFLTPLQSAFTETIQSNNKACKEAHKIIAETTDEMNKAMQEHNNNLNVSAINLFDWCRSFNPSLTALFKVLEGMQPNTEKGSVAKKRTSTTNKKK